MLSLSQCEQITTRIVNIATSCQGVPHDQWCKIFEVIRTVYNMGNNDGFYECKNKMIQIVKED